MENTRKFLLLFLFIGLIATSYAQPPDGDRPPGGRGGRPPGGGPEQMIAREKEAIYSKITDLSEDQKLLIDGIYEEFVVTLKETFEELRQSNDREGRREKMRALRNEKDDLIKDVLNEEQYEIYEGISKTRRERQSQPDDEESPPN